MKEKTLLISIEIVKKGKKKKIRVNILDNNKPGFIIYGGLYDRVSVDSNCWRAKGDRTA